ncbi:hypothetical protein MSAN_00119200 [Mycena sanguinolenta]|uniref:Uncharacterized protein n=1 Tax=Mycena sanguinolenta TaxID=230812 RepID=A0A8H6ZFY9_9AGAR|nr:hypothetical protein MSAN_00119200 [Mycena sanguinolenta]
MDEQINSNREFTHSSACDPQAPSHTSGMFSDSRRFTVVGGTFTNITNNNYTAALRLPHDLRMIPLGDIDLRHLIRKDECVAVVDSQSRERACVRRVHSGKARIDGQESRVTVVMYQGNGAEEEWRRDIATYIHPNIVQICGAASSNGLHAAIFNDDIFWIVIEFPPFRRCIFMRTLIRILRRQSIIFILHSNDHS